MLQPRPSFFYKIQLFSFLGIIALVIIVVIAHYTQQHQEKDKLNITLFSKPREIQAFRLHTGEKQGKLFTQAQLEHHWSLLFFGFTHCSDTCPSTLNILNKVYQDLHALYPILQIVFISIDPEHEKVLDPQHYVESFNKNFIGLSGTTTQLSLIKQQLGVLSEAASTKMPGSSIINHNNSIFLINPQGQWLALLPYGLPAWQLSKLIKNIIESQ